MEYNLEVLQQLALTSVPRVFFERLVARQGTLNEEARAMAFSAPWGIPEAEVAYPQNRRGLFENEFRLSAKAAGLDCSDLKHAGDNYGYVLVRAGKLWITSHHVDRPTRFVRPCLSRKQHAAVNQWLDTPYFEELLQELPPKLGDADRVNAYLLNGVVIEERAGKEFPTLFMRLAFPDPDLERYVRNYDVFDLLQLYGYENGLVIGGLGNGGGSLPDNAKPVINVKPDLSRTKTKNSKSGD